MTGISNCWHQVRLSFRMHCEEDNTHFVGEGKDVSFPFELLTSLVVCDDLEELVDSDLVLVGHDE